MDLAASARRRGLAAIVLIVAAFVIRAVQFGNPVIHGDEEFYLLVGDRMWAGAIPYVDIWDRKPVGLFLLYGMIRGVGGDAVLGYQIAATLFAAATAIVLAAIARRIAGGGAAIIAGLLYLLLLMGNGGDGGQAPVFYNLLVALAVLAAIRASERAQFDLPAVLLSGAAMLLAGIAMQIKYSAVFEGMYLGAALIVLAHRRGVRPARIGALALWWIALALAPTAVAAGWYLAIGHIDAFVFANFRSIFLRPLSCGAAAGGHVLRIALHLLPAALPALVAILRPRWWRGAAETRCLLAGWALAAIAGVAVFGTYFAHYALPLIAPLAICATPVFAARRGAPIAGIALAAAIALAVATVTDRRETRGDGTAERAIAAAIRNQPGAGLYVFSGEPILYLLAGAPPATAWPFPPHLSERCDRNALGTDPDRELARILRSRPQFIVTRDSNFPEADRLSFAQVSATVARDYRLALVRRVGGRTMLLYSRSIRAKP